MTARIRIRALALALTAALIAGTGMAYAETPPLAELAPTGKLRAAVAVGTVISASFATRDPSGKPRGVPVDLARALAAELKVPLELVAYPSSGELTEAASKGAWDVTFTPVDAERAKFIDFGPAYYLFESTLLVPAGSKIAAIADADRPGTRVIAVYNTTTARAAQRVLKQVTVQQIRTTEEIFELMRDGKADAVALGRESLVSLAARLPGSRILPGHLHTSGVAVAVPKGKPASLAYVSAFIERAKASGIVRRALDDAGLTDAAVAPPGARQ